MGWDIVPWGFEKLLSWIQKEYSPKGGILVSWNPLGSAIHVAFLGILHSLCQVFACLQSSLEQPRSLNRFTAGEGPAALHQVTENGCAVRETTEEEAVNDRGWDNGIISNSI